MKYGLAIALGVAVAVGAVKAHDRRQQEMRSLDPAQTPGFICDMVAAKKEPHPTVAWYHACLGVAADIQHGKAK